MGKVDWFILRVVREHLFHACCLASGDFGNLCFSFADRCITLMSALMFIWYSSCVCVSPNFSCL
jgi:hypothetical protein